MLTALCLLPLAALPLSGCGDDPPQSFAPLDFAYLGKLHLSVETINVVDAAPPGSVPGDISAQAPTPPDQALQTMAHERLVATGANGSAVFTITRASITRAPDDTFEGALAIHVDILTPDGQHAGYAEAQVKRTLNAGNSGQSLQQTLYALTAQMMQDMNVELEFQVRRSLRDWMADAGGAPAAGAIQEQSLDAPSPPAPAAVMAPASAPQAPDAIFPTGSGTDAAAPSHSPQAGYLHLPGTTAGQTGSPGQ